MRGNSGIAFWGIAVAISAGTIEAQLRAPVGRSGFSRIS